MKVLLSVCVATNLVCACKARPSHSEVLQGDEMPVEADVAFQTDEEALPHVDKIMHLLNVDQNERARVFAHISSLVSHLHQDNQKEIMAPQVAEAVAPLFSKVPAETKDLVMAYEKIIGESRRLAKRTESARGPDGYLATYYFSEVIRASALLAIEIECRKMKPSDFEMVAQSQGNVGAVANFVQSGSRLRSQLRSALKRVAGRQEILQSELTAQAPQEKVYTLEFLELFISKDSRPLVRGPNFLKDLRNDLE